jgi:type IV pilus assembly protein PilA
MAHRESDPHYGGDNGFTLIEVTVVALIIGVLLAISIPAFLGARTRSQDRAAQSSLRNTMTAAKVIFSDGEDYSSATDAKLRAEEPSLSFVPRGTTSTDPGIVSVDPGISISSRFVAAAYSDSRNCWFTQDVEGGAVNPGMWWDKVSSNGGAGCSADAAPVLGDAAWQRSVGSL